MSHAGRDQLLLYLGEASFVYTTANPVGCSEGVPAKETKVREKNASITKVMET